MEGAVAGHHDHGRLAAQGCLRTQRGAVAEAHGAQTAAGEEAALLHVLDVLGGPHLVLAHVGDVNGVRPGQLAAGADDLMGHQPVIVILRMEIVGLPLADLRPPLFVTGGLNVGEHGGEDHRRVAHHAVPDGHVFAHLGGVDVDLHDGGVVGKALGVQGHTVREAGADGHHHVGLVHRLVAGEVAVHAQNAQVHGVAVAQHAGGHQGMGGGNVRLVDQLLQLGAAAVGVGAAAEVDNGTLGPVDDLSNLTHGDGVILGAGGRRLEGRSRGVFGAGAGHVLGNVHQNGAFAAGLGNAEGLPHGVGQLFHMAHHEVVLGDGHGDAGDIHFLEAVLADQIGAHVAGKGHHGNAVHVRSGDAGDQVGGTRAAGGQHHAGAAGGAGVAVRRVGGALLVGGHNVGDLILCLVQFIVQIQDRTAGIAEHGVYTLFDQNFYKNLCACQHHGELLLERVKLCCIEKNKKRLCLLLKRQRRSERSLRYHSSLP